MKVVRNTMTARLMQRVYTEGSFLPASTGFTGLGSPSLCEGEEAGKVGSTGSASQLARGESASAMGV